MDISKNANKSKKELLSSVFINAQAFDLGQFSVKNKRQLKILLPHSKI